MKQHTLQWKKTELESIKESLQQYPVIGIVDLTMLPAQLFADVRKKLYPESKIKVTKTRILKRALDDANIDFKGLNELVEGPVGIILTSKNPFELYSFIKKNRTNAPAKPGIEAPNDIIVPAGDTGLPPGPALSTLKAAGLETKVQGPTIEVAADKIVTKQGEIVSQEVATVLSTLNIKPLKVGLKILGVFEKGTIFKPEVLDIDTEQMFNDFVSAHSKAFNLAFSIGYTTKENIELFLQKAFNDSKTLALEANVLTKETTPQLLAKASMQAKALQSALPEPTETKSDEQKEETGAKEEKEEEPEQKETTEEKEQSEESKEQEQPKEPEEKSEEANEEKTKEEPTQETEKEKPSETKEEEKKE